MRASSRRLRRRASSFAAFFVGVRRPSLAPLQAASWQLRPSVATLCAATVRLVSRQRSPPVPPTASSTGHPPHGSVCLVVLTVALAAALAAPALLADRRRRPRCSSFVRNGILVRRVIRLVGLPLPRPRRESLTASSSPPACGCPPFRDPGRVRRAAGAACGACGRHADSPSPALRACSRSCCLGVRRPSSCSSSSSMTDLPSSSGSMIGSGGSCGIGVNQRLFRDGATEDRIVLRSRPFRPPR